MVFYFGSHISSHGNLVETTNNVLQAGGNLIQIMLTIKGNRLVSDKSKPKLIELSEHLKDNNMIAIVHSSYTHNIARSWDYHSWWLKNMELEIEYASVLGAKYIVIHLGKSLDLSKEEAYNNMYTFLVHLHSKTLKYIHIKILLETSTGQGSELCYKLEDLSHFYKKISNSINRDFKKRIKLCVDTCHIFSAGYDIRTTNSIKLYFEAFEELIGLRYIYLLHLNDSKVELGKQVDRHANIGKGYIGYKSLSKIFEMFKRLNIPIVLETPGDGYKTEINKLLN